MKVLINGSPRPQGNTAIALGEVEQIFQAEGVETGLVQVGNASRDGLRLR